MVENVTFSPTRQGLSRPVHRYISKGEGWAEEVLGARCCHRGGAKIPAASYDFQALTLFDQGRGGGYFKQGESNFEILVPTSIRRDREIFF